LFGISKPAKCELSITTIYEGLAGVLSIVGVAANDELSRIIDDLELIVIDPNTRQFLNTILLKTFPAGVDNISGFLRYICVLKLPFSHSTIICFPFEIDLPLSKFICS